MSWAWIGPGQITRRPLTRRGHFMDMIRTRTTEWFWGASHQALKKAARGVASSRIT